MPSEKAFRPIDYVKISIFGAALSFLWPTLQTLVIPLRLLELTPETQKNTYLGILTFCGLVLAALVQPLAGAISDRSSFRLGRRRPFILVGTLLALLFLPGIGLSKSFILLFLCYCLLQCACNTAQGPFQAFIPDLVPPKRRGVASGAKTLAEVAAGVTCLWIVTRFMGSYAGESEKTWLWPAIGLPWVVLLGGMIATLLTVKELPQPSCSEPFSVKTVAGSYKIDVRRHSSFVWFLVSRLFILMALGTIQSFALYFLRDVVHISNPARVTGDLLVAVGIFLLIAIYPAGQLSDRFGRKPIILVSGFVGAVGILVLLSAQTYSSVLVCGGFLGVSAGAFLSASWALATDLVPPGEEARYLGLTNLATAGAGALARLIGPVIDFLNARQSGLGYSTMLLACVLYFILGSASVIMVREKVKEEG